MHFKSVLNAKLISDRKWFQMLYYNLKLCTLANMEYSAKIEEPSWALQKYFNNELLSVVTPTDSRPINWFTILNSILKKYVYSNPLDKGVHSLMIKRQMPTKASNVSELIFQFSLVYIDCNFLMQYVLKWLL